MLPVGLICGFLLASVVSYVIPKKYESFATIEVRPMRYTEGGTEVDPATPDFFATEFEKIKSRNSLEKVIDRLDLVNKWGLDRESALRILKSIVVAENIRGTDLISIRVRHTSRENARDITAEVARAYKEYRTELESKSLDRGINELKKAVREQEDKVEEIRKKLGGLTGPFLLDGSNLPPPDESEPTDILDSRNDFDREQALLEAMKLKLVSKEINFKSTPESVVVHDDPVISDSPVSPNVVLNLVLGALGGMLVSPFFALPIMCMLNRKHAV